VYAVYVRVSEVGEREGDKFGSPQEQEAGARGWAERNDAEVYFVEEECVDLDVSGATDASERKLGDLIDRCESGEFEGLIFYNLERFSRDKLSAGVALLRLKEAGVKAIFVQQGLVFPAESNLVVDILLAVAEDQRERLRLARIKGRQRAAERGLHLAARVPYGYKWVDRQKGGRGQEDGAGIGRLEPEPDKAKKVQEAFRRRADGTSYGDLAKFLGVAGKSSARAIITNRVYVGEATVPTERKGVTRTVKKAHPPLVDETLWEAANAQGGRYMPRTGKWSSLTQLNGIARCAGCKKPLTAGSIRGKQAYYSCTHEHCKTKTGIKAAVLDEYVALVLTAAVQEEVPAVVATLEGDDRYQRALDAVQEAQAELEAYRSTVKVSVVGAAAFERDVAARQEAVKLARQALREVPRTKLAYSEPLPVTAGQWTKATKEERVKIVEAAMEKDKLARFIDRVEVRQCGRGKIVPPAERVEVYFHGSEAMWFMAEGGLGRLEEMDPDRDYIAEALAGAAA
jgi:site-specific DNA recombinase